MMKPLEWLRTPFSRTMTELEVANSTPQAVAAMMEYPATWENNLPDQARLGLMIRLDETVQASEYSVQKFLASFSAMMRGLNVTLPPEKRLQPARLEQVMTKLRGRVVENLSNQVIVGFMYTYRTVSDADMERHIAFYESEAGQWFVKNMQGAMLAAMAEASEDFGSKVQALASAQ